MGEPGREPPMVVGAKERVEWARKDVVARGGQETEGAGHVPRGEQGKANTGDREVVPPREESLADRGGVLTEGRVVLRRGGLGIGVVGGDQGAPCVGEGVVDLEACLGGTNLTLRADGDPKNGQKISLLASVANSETHRKNSISQNPSVGLIFHIVSPSTVKLLLLWKH